MSASTQRRRRAARRLPRLQAVPPRRLARLAGVEHPRRSRRARAAADRRRRHRPRGRAGAGPRLGYSERQVHRTLVAEVGAGPLALARAQRAQTARVLLETTELPVDRRRVRGRVRQRAPVQRHRPRGVRGAARRAARRPARRRPAEPGRRRAAPALPRADGASRRCSTSSARTPCRASRPTPTACSPASSTPPAGRRWWRCRAGRRRRAVPGAAAPRRAISSRSWRGCGGCSISTPTRSPSTPRSGRDAALAPLVRKRPGAAGARRRRRLRDRDPHRRRPADLAARRPHRARPHRRRARPAGASTASRGGSFPSADDAGRGRPGDAADAAGPRAASVHALAAAFAAGGLDARPRRRPRRAIRAAAARAARHRARGRPTTCACAPSADPDVLLASDLVVRRAAADLGIDLAGGRPDWAPWRTYATYHLWAHLYADLWSVTAR